MNAPSTFPTTEARHIARSEEGFALPGERLAVLQDRIALMEANVARWRAVRARAAKIVDRVLPDVATPSGYLDPEGFIASARRFAARNDLFRAVEKRLTERAGGAK